MKRLRGQGGSALILMLGVTATLAIFAVTLVLVIGNSQGATASTREQTQAFNVAEAGLDSALVAVGTQAWPSTAGSYFSEDSLNEAFQSLDDAEVDQSDIQAYDNLASIDTTVKWDSNGDGVMWVDSQVTMSDGKSARVRTQVKHATTSSPWTSLDAALYTDGNVSVGSGYVWAKTSAGGAYVDANGNPLSNVYARGNVTRTSWNWPYPSTVGFKLGYTDANGVAHPGTDKWTGHYPNMTTTHNDGVQPLSSVLPQSTVDSLVAQAQVGKPPAPSAANANGHVVTTSEKNALQASSPQTYTATQDLVVNGDLTLTGGVSTFNFKSLYVTGNLTLSGNTLTTTTALYVGGDFTVSVGKTQSFGSVWVNGNVTLGSESKTSTTSLYVGKNFTIAGTSAPQSFGATYVGGNVSWNSGASVTCASLYVGGTFTSDGGPFSHQLGPTYVAGNVTLKGAQAGIIAPLFVTGGNVTSAGGAFVGSLTSPTLLLVYNSSGSRTVTWDSNGVFTGLMADMSGGVSITSGGNGSFTDVVGAIMSTADINITNNAGVLYVPDVLANLPITTSMTTTSAVSGTWQELSPNAN